MIHLLVSLLFLGNNLSIEPKQIHFDAIDGITIYGDLYLQDKEGTTILLFHQGGSNARAEYLAIIPNLLKNGYNILAIDQRQGGQIYGRYNRTVAQISMNEFTYCDAFQDLEGALDYLLKEGFSGKKILWGSSYSASLSIQLAHKRTDDLNGVLAFSPASGGPMKECRPDPYFESLKIPLLILRPESEAQLESVKKQLTLAKQFGHQTYVAKIGIHGSSMMVSDRVGGSTEENWKVVYTFLEALNK